MPISQKRFQFLLSAYGPAILAGLQTDRTLRDNRPDTAEEALQLLMLCDPSVDDKNNRGRYMTWLCRTYKTLLDKRTHDHAMLFEDFARIREYLLDYDRKKHLLPVTQRDINRLSFDELKDIIRHMRGSNLQTKSERRTDIDAETTVLYDGPEGLIVIPHSIRASCFWGMNTEWCTSTSRSKTSCNDFQHYNLQSPLSIMVPARSAGKRYQAHKKSTFKNQNDQDINIQTPSEDLLKLLSGLSVYKKIFLNNNCQDFPTASVFDCNDEDIALLLIEQGILKLGPETKTFNKNRKLVLAAVRQNGWALQFADPSLTKDREIVLAAVQQNEWALQFADPSLTKDPEIVLAAVQKNGEALQYADQSLTKDRKIVLAAVRQNGWALQFADPSLKKNREIILAAVQQNGVALQFADPSLKKNREIILAAVQQNGVTLQFADPSLTKDPEIVLAAVQQSGWALQFADPSLTKDREIVLTAVQQSGWALQFADPSLKKDREIVLAAVRQNGTALQCADPSLKDDPDFIQEAVKANIYVLESTPATQMMGIPKDVLVEGFWNTIDRDWRAIGYIHDAGIELTPAQELEIFERAMRDTGGSPYSFHLFPTLRIDGFFIEPGDDPVNAARARLQARCGDTPAPGQIARPHAVRQPA